MDSSFASTWCAHSQLLWIEIRSKPICHQTAEYERPQSHFRPPKWLIWPDLVLFWSSCSPTPYQSCRRHMKRSFVYNYYYYTVLPRRMSNRSLTNRRRSLCFCSCKRTLQADLLANIKSAWSVLVYHKSAKQPGRGLYNLWHRYYDMACMYVLISVTVYRHKTRNAFDVLAFLSNSVLNVVKNDFSLFTRQFGHTSQHPCVM